ncbi:hypothetical protein FJTKL_00656 [Diaporthe vaccinii]|uniref:Secreted protein n=1 Tax=Diaporthe vaccinii TaxID=105482 RepID=A0ABR4F633_9PEZI
MNGFSCPFFLSSLACPLDFSRGHRRFPSPSTSYLFLTWRGIFTDSACNFSWFASPLHCPVAPFVSELCDSIKISHCVPVTIALSTSAFTTG